MKYKNQNQNQICFPASNLFFLVFLTLLFAVGCSNNVRVSGVVTYTDGTPVDRGQVVFENDKVLYYGYIKPNGSFSLGVYKDGQGIPTGKYRASVENAIDDNDQDLVAAKYRNPKTSGFEFDIAKKTTGISIVVEPASKK
ncbi:MAG: hypothetical protein LBT09_12160 [Planctomycetaceae bacterium]|jgi:hypothetical protein|nr:hypothetical protein [Planctomycetaceae bacterium]